MNKIILIEFCENLFDLEITKKYIAFGIFSMIEEK